MGSRSARIRGQGKAAPEEGSRGDARRYLRSNAAFVAAFVASSGGETTGAPAGSRPKSINTNHPRLPGR
eukprot:scaffold69_cov248-Pinguiococcus_pyrenoidosus.AAC.82